MKNSKLTMLGLVVAALALQPAQSPAPPPPPSPFTTGLQSGKKGPVVGEVQVWNDANFLYVKYLMSAGWCLDETHLAVATNLSGIPQKNGNPPPGQFKYKGEDLDCAADWSQKIPLNGWTPGTKLFIAAHGVACGATNNGVGSGPDITNFCASLPDSVIAGIYLAGVTSYFNVVIPDAGVLQGEWPGWCLSTNIEIAGAGVYTTAVYCSYTDVLPGFVPPVLQTPAGIKQINFLLNQNYVGQGGITQGDVQVAIWQLMGQGVLPGTVGIDPWDQNRVDLILADVQANAANYVPKCDDLAAVILIPYNDAGAPQQPVLIPVPLPCKPVIKECGTVWGQGLNFPGKNWAMYFNYTVQGPN